MSLLTLLLPDLCVPATDKVLLQASRGQSRRG